MSSEIKCRDFAPLHSSYPMINPNFSHSPPYIENCRVTSWNLHWNSPQVQNHSMFPMHSTSQSFLYLMYGKLPWIEYCTGVLNKSKSMMFPFHSISLSFWCIPYVLKISIEHWSHELNLALGLECRIRTEHIHKYTNTIDKVWQIVTHPNTHTLLCALSDLLFAALLSQGLQCVHSAQSSCTQLQCTQCTK